MIYPINTAANSFSFEAHGTLTAHSSGVNLKPREREQFKIFQDKGIVIVVLSNDDLEAIATGANLAQLLRQALRAGTTRPSGARDAGY